MGQDRLGHYAARGSEPRPGLRRDLLIVLGVAVFLVLVGVVVRYVMPRAVPQLELLSSEGEPAPSALLGTNARLVGIFIGGLVLGAVINELVGRVL